MKTLYIFLLGSMMMFPVTAHATADGPDYFAVTDVASDDVLNIRRDRHYKAKKVGEIPYDAVAIENLGCDSEAISLGEWARLSEQEKKAQKAKKWCRVRYDDLEGWVSGRYLKEYEFEHSNQVVADTPVKESLSPSQQEWMTSFLNDTEFAEDQLFSFYGVYASVKKLNTVSSKYFSSKEVAILRRAIKTVENGYTEHRPDIDHDETWREMEASMGGLIKLADTYSKRPSYTEVQTVRGTYLEFMYYILDIAQVFSGEDFADDMPNPSGIEKDF